MAIVFSGEKIELFYLSHLAIRCTLTRALSPCEIHVLVLNYNISLLSLFYASFACRRSLQNVARPPKGLLGVIDFRKESIGMTASSLVV